MITDQQGIAGLGKILGIWAHPDDETFTMGGILEAAVRNGQQVVCVTATRGEAGVQDVSRWPAEELGIIRTEELQAALDILGVRRHHWLDYPDGGCKKVPIELAVSKVAEYIIRYQPDSIFTFGPDGLTGHDDHRMVSEWVTQAVSQAGSRAAVYHAAQTKAQYQDMRRADKKFNIFFNITEPRICTPGECAVLFELPDDLYEQKLAAMRAMPSQNEALLKAFNDTLRSSLGTEAFSRAQV